MNPEFSPAPAARNGGRPSLSAEGRAAPPPRSRSCTSRPHTSRGASDKNQRIVYSGVCLGFKYFAAVRQRITDSAMHLRNAAQRVGVLHAAAFAVRLSNLAALQHAA